MKRPDFRPLDLTFNYQPKTKFNDAIDPMVTNTLTIIRLASLAESFLFVFLCLFPIPPPSQNHPGPGRSSTSGATGRRFAYFRRTSKTTRTIAISERGLRSLSKPPLQIGQTGQKPATAYRLLI